MLPIKKKLPVLIDTSSIVSRKQSTRRVQKQKKKSKSEERVKTNIKPNKKKKKETEL